MQDSQKNSLKFFDAINVAANTGANTDANTIAAF